jgi:hypothetical protein
LIQEFFLIVLLVAKPFVEALAYELRTSPQIVLQERQHFE